MLAIGINRPPKPLEKIACTFTRISTREPDDDNNRASFKPIRDALKECGIVVDDSPRHMPDPQYKWEPGNRGQGHVRVTVEEIA